MGYFENLRGLRPAPKEKMKNLEDWKNRIIHGDAYDKLQELPDDSIDLIASDPQYGWSFMGKDWDKALPRQEIYNECLRVLKPGAFMFWMSGARLDGLTENGIRIRNAGLKTGFTPIFWTYATGFPKASNICKTVDKRLGAEVKIGTGFKTAGEYGDRNLKNPTPQGEARDAMRHQPQTEQAKLLEGSYAGFQPKPAVEVIIVAMKPLSEKSYIDQALKNGKGITWLDETRIPFKNNESYEYPKGPGGKHANPMDWDKPAQRTTPQTSNQKGRFTPHLLVEDDVLDDGKITKSGVSKIFHESYKGTSNTELLRGVSSPENQHPDKGSFSRYFSLDAWWEERIKELPREVQKTFPFLTVPKASKSERNKGLGNMRKEEPFNMADTKRGWAEFYPDGSLRPRTPRQNTHPTTKPIKLFTYLVTLGSREGDLVLDPFIGSGTTAIACKMLNRNFIGFEISQEYVTIANARLDVEQKAI